MIKIYTDGSCLRNPGDGGWAAIIIIDGETKEIRMYLILQLMETLMIAKT